MRPWDLDAWREIAQSYARNRVRTALTLISVGLVSGHLYLGLIHPTTRHALRGMTLGEVREDWAREHHPKWLEERRGL